jgi:hypothetical protein
MMHPASTTHRPPREASDCQRTALSRQGNPPGALRATLTSLPAPAGSSAKPRRFAMCISAACIIVAAIAPAPAHADLSSLKPGLYVAKAVGCGGLGGAGTIDFDGTNFSGHYALCKTVPIQGQRDRYQSTCIETQGPKQPKPSDIDSSPDKETFAQTIVALGPQEFSLNGKSYTYCGAR